MNVGRGFLGIGGALRAFHLSSGAVNLRVRVTIDQAAFQSKLTALLDAAGIAPENAQIAINGSSVSVTPERNGSLPDFAAVEKQLVTALKHGQTPRSVLSCTLLNHRSRRRRLRPPRRRFSNTS